MEFVIKNNTSNPVLIDDLGVVINPEDQIDLAYIVPIYMIFESTDLFNLIQSGFLLRIVNDIPVGSDQAYSDIVIERSDPTVSGSYAKSIALKAESLARIIGSLSYPFGLEYSELGYSLKVKCTSYVYMMTHTVQKINGISLVLFVPFLNKSSGSYAVKIEHIRSSSLIKSLECCYKLSYSSNIATCSVFPLILDLSVNDSIVVYVKSISGADEQDYNSNTKLIILGRA